MGSSPSSTATIADSRFDARPHVLRPREDYDAVRRSERVHSSLTTLSTAASVAASLIVTKIWMAFGLARMACIPCGGTLSVSTMAKLCAVSSCGTICLEATFMRHIDSYQPRP